MREFDSGGEMTTQMASSGAGQPDEPPAPEIPSVGGPVWVGWREGTLTRAAELQALCEWIGRKSPQREPVLTTAIQHHLEAARVAARSKESNPHRNFHAFRDGALIERALGNLDAAEAFILALAPADYVLGQMPCLLRHVQCHLPPGDPRRQEFERIARALGIKDADNPPVSTDQESTLKKKIAIVQVERRKITNIVRGASSAALREHVRLRSFRNIVVATTLILALLVIGIAITGFVWPTLMPICFAPEEAGVATVVCPTGESEPFVPLGGQPQDSLPVQDIDNEIARTVSRADLVVVELVGLTAAAIAAAAAIRGIRGSSERYGLPVALAALKLPTGAITAFLGLLLIRGEFVPGLSALDTSGQIVAWALVFGFSQQLFTRLVDQQGQSVLDSVRGADKPQLPSSP